MDCVVDGLSTLLVSTQRMATSKGARQQSELGKVRRAWSQWHLRRCHVDYLVGRFPQAYGQPGCI